MAEVDEKIAESVPDSDAGNVETDGQFSEGQHLKGSSETDANDNFGVPLKDVHALQTNGVSHKASNGFADQDLYESSSTNGHEESVLDSSGDVVDQNEREPSECLHASGDRNDNFRLKDVPSDSVCDETANQSLCVEASFVSCNVADLDSTTDEGSRPLGYDESVITNLSMYSCNDAELDANASVATSDLSNLSPPEDSSVLVSDPESSLTEKRSEYSSADDVLDLTTDEASATGVVADDSQQFNDDVENSKLSLHVDIEPEASSSYESVSSSLEEKQEANSVTAAENVHTEEDEVTSSSEVTSDVQHCEISSTTETASSQAVQVAEESVGLDEGQLDGADKEGKGQESTGEESKPAAEVQKPVEEWVRVLGNESLLKKTLTTGKGLESRPKHGQYVTVSYIGRLSSGRVVDQSESCAFIIGDGDVIQALDICLPLIELNEVALIDTDSRFAYGNIGRQPDIPGGARLQYTVELMQVEDAPSIDKLTPAQRLWMGEKKKDRGNYYYARNENSSAISLYTRALRYLEDAETGASDEEKMQLLDSQAKCANNLAAAQLKIEAWDAAQRSCDLVLKIQPKNVKALFRKSKALCGAGEVSKAIAILRYAQKCDPADKSIADELAKLTKRLAREMDSEKNLYQKMLGTKKKETKVQQTKSSSRNWWYVGGASVAALVAIGLVSAFRNAH